MPKNIDYSPYNETSQSLSKWLDIIKTKRVSLCSQILHNIPPKTVALEIGAGSSWLSSELSKQPNIKSICATEINKRRLFLAQHYFAEKLSADMSKLYFRQSDFHNLKFIQNDSIDIVFIDAALHHTKTLNKLLQEMHRVLKNNGKIIALREPILPTLPILKQYRKITFGRKQIKNGDIEEIYSKSEWVTMFNKNNFDLQFFPLYGTHQKDAILQKYLAFLNGTIFNRYYLLATKRNLLPAKRKFKLLF